MTGNKQSQSATENAIALQAQGDINIGASISEVMQIVAANIQIYSEMARQQVNDRLAEFERRLTEQLASGRKNSIDSFSDPDFQGALLDAQKAYARSDSEDLHQVLTDLVYRRSLEKKRNRISIVINDAITRSSNLTKTDFANLAFIFYIMDVGVTGRMQTEFLADRLKSHIEPLFDDLDFSTDALGYLQSQGTFLIGPSDQGFHPNPLPHLLKHKYSEALTLGLTRDQIVSISDWGEGIFKFPFVRKSTFNPENYVIEVTRSGLDDMSRSIPKFKGVGERYQSLCQKSLPSDDDVINQIEKIFPIFRELCNKYKNSRVGVTKLSPVGKALAHSYIAKSTPFSGPLELWIKP